MKNIITLLLANIFLFQACTHNDRHPDIPTLEKLIENGEVIFIEKKDPVSLLPFITFFSDSVYYKQFQHHGVSESSDLGNNQKTVPDVTIENSFELKNINNGKIYISRRINSKSPVLINEKNDIILDNVIFLAPDYITKTKVDTVVAREITAIKPGERLKVLDEFDKSVIYKWTNTGRLGTIHKLFYYQLDGKKFKTESECYLITENGEYFYNDRLGILKIK